LEEDATAASRFVPADESASSTGTDTEISRLRRNGAEEVLEKTSLAPSNLYIYSTHDSEGALGFDSEARPLKQ